MYSFALTFTTLRANSADIDDTFLIFFFFFFFFFFYKTGFDISWKLLILETSLHDLSKLFLGKIIIKKKYLNLSCAENFTLSAER